MFVNFDNHGLSLSVIHAASQDQDVVTFFGTIENIYLFFSRSTFRWENMREALKISVKRESETHWSDRAVAVKASHDGVNDLVDLLERLSVDLNETRDTRCDAQNLLQSILTFNFLVFLPF